MCSALQAVRPSTHNIGDIEVFLNISSLFLDINVKIFSCYLHLKCLLGLLMLSITVIEPDCT